MYKVAEGTDMVQVTMSEYMTADLVFVFLQIGDIRRDVVDAGIVSTRKQKSHVDDDDFVVILDCHHVFADTHLAQPADRHDL